MSFDGFLGFGDVKLSVVIQKAVESLEDLRWSEIEFIEDDPIAISDCLNKHTLLKHEFLICRGDIRTQVLLDVSVEVVVDSNHLIMSNVGQILHSGSFTCRCRAFKNHSVICDSNDRGKFSNQGAECLCEDEILWIEVCWRVSTLWNHELLDVSVFFCVRV